MKDIIEFYCLFFILKKIKIDLEIYTLFYNTNVNN